MRWPAVLPGHLILLFFIVPGWGSHSEALPDILALDDRFIPTGQSLRLFEKYGVVSAHLAGELCLNHLLIEDIFTIL
jgi:hypothetical protein